MPSNISFALTTQQFRDRTKTVTRRLGWANAKPGQVLMGCEKCMGLKKGEKVTRLGPIRLLSVRREPLQRMIDDPDYGRQEAILEGFPDMDGLAFVAFFVRKNCVHPSSLVTRLEFEYIDDPMLQPCPLPIAGDDGSATDCIAKGHCGCGHNAPRTAP